MKKIAVLIVSLGMFAACQNAANNNLVANQTKQTANSNAAPLLPIDNAAKAKPAEAVKITSQKIVLKRAGDGVITINLDVLPPFHINSNPPSEKSFIPTELVFQSTESFNVGKISYPKGVSKTFSFSEKPVSVYEGAATTIKIPVSANKNESGDKVLNGELKFQPCDDEVCYPPQSIAVMLPVTVN